MAMVEPENENFRAYIVVRRSWLAVEASAPVEQTRSTASARLGRRSLTELAPPGQPNRALPRLALRQQSRLERRPQELAFSRAEPQRRRRRHTELRATTGPVANGRDPDPETARC